MLAHITPAESPVLVFAISAGVALGLALATAILRRGARRRGR